MRYTFKNKKPPYNKVCIGIRGQFGDIIMQEPGLRKFISDNPSTKIVLAVYEKYKDILPLFYNYHENIIEFKAFEGYDKWPTEKDLQYIEKQGFDAMFPPDIPLHEQDDWPNYRHITEETALMIGLDSTTNKIEMNLPEDVVKEPKTVCIHMFSSKWPGGIRSVGIKKQTLIVDYLKRNGYKVYQISSPNQPHIEGAIFPKGTYYDACVRVLSSDFLVSCDSGMPWITSAYNHPTLALFSYGYNNMVKTTKNWQPLNPNGIYLESYKADNISIYKIYSEIDELIRRTK